MEQGKSSSAPEETLSRSGQRRKATKKTWIARVVLLGATVLICLFFCEFAVRILMPQQLIQFHPEIWRPIEGLGWDNQPNADVSVNTGEREIRWTTNEFGHRIDGSDQSAHTEAVRILALGDSFLQALQVDYGDTFPARLEVLLSGELGKPVTVVNTGVGAWGPGQYLLKAKEELVRQEYDLLLCFLFLGNDIVNAPPRQRAPRAPARRHHLRLPRSFEKKEIIDSLLYPVNDFLEVRSHLFILARSSGKFGLMRFGLSAHNLPPVLLRNEADSRRWEVTAGICDQIDKVAQEAGTPSLFVFLPGVYQIDRDTALRYAASCGVDAEEIDEKLASRILGEQLASRGLRYFDATPALRRAFANGTILYGTVDTHFAPGGHRVTASALSPVIVDALPSQGVPR